MFYHFDVDGKLSPVSSNTAHKPNYKGSWGLVQLANNVYVMLSLVISDGEGMGTGVTNFSILHFIAGFGIQKFAAVLVIIFR